MKHHAKKRKGQSRQKKYIIEIKSRLMARMKHHEKKRKGLSRHKKKKRKGQIRQRKFTKVNFRLMVLKMDQVMK
jgi:hypothetical protein